MGHPTRRSVLMVAGTGGLGAMGALAGAATLGGYRQGVPSSGELAGVLPRVPEDARPSDRCSPGRDEALRQPTEPASAFRVRELHLSPGAGLEHLGISVTQRAAEFVCDPRRPNRLLTGARRVAYEIVEVAWQPHEGGPLYRSRSPLASPAFGTRYAGVPRHQIVLLDDHAVYVNNPGASGVIEGIRGPLRIDVNGEDAASHRGFYKVLITAIA